MNSVLILNRRRFLAKHGLDDLASMGGSVADQSSNPLRGQIVGLLHAVQYLKPIVILANCVTIAFELILGGSWSAQKKKLKNRRSYRNLPQNFPNNSCVNVSRGQPNIVAGAFDWFIEEVNNQITKTIGCWFRSTEIVAIEYDWNELLSVSYWRKSKGEIKNITFVVKFGRCFLLQLLIHDWNGNSLFVQVIVWGIVFLMFCQKMTF